MPVDIKKVRIFVASPSDVQNERDILNEIVEDLNLTFGAENNLLFELIKWETHTFPDVGDDAQDVINKQITEYDIFLGIMWSRFGTPTKRAKSGTKEEFDKALELYLKYGKPLIMFYFKIAPIYQKTVDDIEQTKYVIEFKNSLMEKGVYFREYENDLKFQRHARNHLWMQANNLIRYRNVNEESKKVNESNEKIKDSIDSNELSNLKKEVSRLASLIDSLLHRQEMTKDFYSTDKKIAITSRYQIIDEIKDELNLEKNQISLLGISLGDFILDRGVLHSSFINLLESNKNIRIRALILNPHSEALKIRAHFECGLEYGSVPEFYDSTTFIETDGASRVAKHLSSKYSNLEIRNYNLSPLCYLIVTSSKIFYEPYSYASRGSHGIILKYDSVSDFYKTYVNHFDKLWKESVDIKKYDPLKNLNNA